MNRKFKVTEKGQPGAAGSGEKKYYASARSSGNMTLTKLTTSIEKVSTVSGADIRAVLYTMVDVMKAARTIFIPGVQLKNQLKTLKYEKA